MSRRVTKIALLIIGVIASYILSSFFFNIFDSTNVRESTSNTFFFGIVYLHIFILLTLGLIVGRNISKLFFDRRMKTLGAKLRTKLVLALVGVTLIPTLLLYFVASGLLNNAFQGWFSSKIESAIEASVLLSRKNFSELKQQVKTTGDNFVRKTIKSSGLFETGREEELKEYIEDFRRDKGLFRITIFNTPFESLVTASHPAANVESFKEPSPSSAAISDAFTGKNQIISDLEESGQFIRSYVDFKVNDERRVALLSYRIDPELSEAFSAVQESFSSIGQLKLFRQPLQSSYTLTLILVTVSVVFAAAWLAFSIAKYIIGPIEDLVEATEEISRGNYDIKIDAKGDDEIFHLVRSFNRMTSDLEFSRNEANRRRILIETIVRNLTVGVISLDRDNKIENFNLAASQIFSMENSFGRPIKDVLGFDDYLNVYPVLQKVDILHAGEVVENEFSVRTLGRDLQIVCAASKIIDEKNEWIGTLILLEDLTDLIKAQQLSAWREVARRIAHEIKNPLTPMQLSAQRLEKLLGDDVRKDVIKECVLQITENIESIKRLANEFSNFARMPTAIFEECDLNQLISEVVSTFVQQYQNVVLQFIADNKITRFSCDAEQIRRVLLNLLENAVAAIEAVGSEKGKIDVRSNLNTETQTLVIEVADNGMGIVKGNKNRVFDPYYTTKKEGTGLGLAIVATIVAEHQGQIKVYDNLPNGTKFVIELPLVRKSG